MTMASDTTLHAGDRDDYARPEILTLRTQLVSAGHTRSSWRH